MRQKLDKGLQAYSWGSAAKLLGAELEEVRNWIVSGDLKIVDGFVTKRAFQEFCEKRSSEINCALLGNDVRDWLVEGYPLPVHAESVAPAMPGNQKHALITRHCPKCKRPIRGNIFFRHIKGCEGIALPRRSEISAGGPVPSRTMPTSV